VRKTQPTMFNYYIGLLFGYRKYLDLQSRNCVILEKNIYPLMCGMPVIGLQLKGWK